MELGLSVADQSDDRHEEGQNVGDDASDEEVASSVLVFEYTFALKLKMHLLFNAREDRERK